MGNCLTCCQACCCGPGDSDSYPDGGYGQSKELRAILVGGGDAQVRLLTVIPSALTASARSYHICLLLKLTQISFTFTESWQ